jgi:hypothetical protein
MTHGLGAALPPIPGLSPLAIIAVNTTDKALLGETLV